MVKKYTEEHEWIEMDADNKIGASFSTRNLIRRLAQYQTPEQLYVVYPLEDSTANMALWLLQAQSV